MTLRVPTQPDRLGCELKAYKGGTGIALQGVREDPSLNNMEEEVMVFLKPYWQKKEKSA